MNIEYILKSLRMQSWYIYFLFFQLVVILTLTGYEISSLGNHTYHLFTFIIEFLISFGFTAEILIRMIFSKTAFFKNVLNIFDFLVLCVLSVLFFISFAYSTHLCDFECNTIFPIVLLSIRYGVQIVRILTTIKNIEAIKKAATIEICIQDILEGEDDELLSDITDEMDSPLARL